MGALSVLNNPYIDNLFPKGSGMNPSGAAPAPPSAFSNLWNQAGAGAATGTVEPQAAKSRAAAASPGAAGMSGAPQSSQKLLT
jgi:hypothetical protein